VSDVSQGPGWWLATDKKWYPPRAASEQHRQRGIAPRVAGFVSGSVGPWSGSRDGRPSGSRPAAELVPRSLWRRHPLLGRCDLDPARRRGHHARDVTNSIRRLG